MPDQERFERRRPSSLHGQWRPLWQIFLFGRLCQGVVFFLWFLVGWFWSDKKVANHRFGGIDWKWKVPLDLRWNFNKHRKSWWILRYQLIQVVTFLGWCVYVTLSMAMLVTSNWDMKRSRLESPGISLCFFCHRTNVDRCMSYIETWGFQQTMLEGILIWWCVFLLYPLKYWLLHDTTMLRCGICSRYCRLSLFWQEGCDQCLFASLPKDIAEIFVENSPWDRSHNMF